MIFTNKVNYSRSNFYADFFQLSDADDEESKIWRRRVVIQESDLHTVGQHLGRQSVVSSETRPVITSPFRWSVLQCPHVRQDRAAHSGPDRQSSGLLPPAGQNKQDKHGPGISTAEWNTLIGPNPPDTVLSLVSWRQGLCHNNTPQVMQNAMAISDHCSAPVW